MATAVNKGVGVAARGFQPSFHLWMTLLMAAFVFTGFGMTYIAPLLTGTFKPAPPIVHLHGAVLFSWMVLLVTQSLLVNARNVRLHRSLGTFGISVATLVVVLSGTMQVVGASITTLKGSGPGVFFPGLRRAAQLRDPVRHGDPVGPHARDPPQPHPDRDHQHPHARHSAAST